MHLPEAWGSHRHHPKDLGWVASFFHRIRGKWAAKLGSWGPVLFPQRAQFNLSSKPWSRNWLNFPGSQCVCFCFERKGIQERDGLLPTTPSMDLSEPSNTFFVGLKETSTAETDRACSPPPARHSHPGWAETWAEGLTVRGFLWVTS